MHTTLLLLTALACNDESAECPVCPAPAEAAPVAAEAPSNGTTLADWEAALLRDQIVDLRAGVRPFGDRGFGLCTGTKTCNEFLGAEPGALKPGSYILRAELSVPQLGAGWRVKLERTCDDGAAPYTREFDVRYAGDSRGYRLEPLFRIELKEGATPKACTATLTPLRPDGEAATPLSASWTSGAPG